MFKKDNVIYFLKKFNYVNTTIIVLSATTSIYILHRITSGAILQSRALTVLTFFIFIFVFAFPPWPWMKYESQTQKENTWIIISLLSILVVIWFWGGETGFSTDYKKFKMFSMQLQNGFPKPHYFYSHSPNSYPALSITSVAIISNISGLGIHRSIFLFSLIIAFFIPLVTYRLSRAVHFNKMTSFFFACLISLYGGFLSEYLERLPHVYLPASQITLHFISRALNLFLFLTFLTIWFETYKKEKGSYKTSIILGLLVGLMGITNPQAFVVGMIFLSITFILDLVKKRLWNHNLISLAIATGISLISWGETLYEMIKGYVRLNTESGSSTEIYPSNLIEFLILYGALPLLAVSALLRKEKWEPWRVVSAISLTSLVVYRIILAIVLPGKEMLIFRINRFGPYIFLFLALLACGGVSILLGKKRNLSIILMTIIILTGYMSNIRYLDKRYKTKPAKFSGLFSAIYIPHGRHKLEKLRRLVSDSKKTVIVPVYRSQEVAWETGLDVPWVNKPRFNFKHVTEKTISQDERYNQTQTFYEELNRKKLRKDIARLFGAECFMAGQKGLEKKFNVILKGELKLPRKKEKNGKKTKKWYVYQITYSNQENNLNTKQ